MRIIVFGDLTPCS